jgi:hypothetical protein
MLARKAASAGQGGGSVENVPSGCAEPAGQGHGRQRQITGGRSNLRSRGLQSISKAPEPHRW